MATKTDGERLERVEANLETLTKLVETQGKILVEIKENQLVTQATTASKDYVDTKVLNAQTAFTAEISAQKRKNALQVWVTGSLSAVFGAVLSLLVAFFIANISK